MRLNKIVTMLVSATLGLFLLFVSPGDSHAVPFDLTAGGDFGTGEIGTTASAEVDGLTLTLSALQDIGHSDPTSVPFLMNNETVTAKVFVDPAGVGVKDGSEGISGKGGHKDEALGLTFSTPVLTSLFVLTLADYQISATNIDESGDEFLIYFDPILTSSEPNLRESDFPTSVFGVPVDGVWELNFSSLTSLPLSFTTMYVRNTDDPDSKHEEFFVSGVNATNPVPEPATMLLFGAGLVGLFGLGRKKFFKRS
jgi:hypothetical protein